MSNKVKDAIATAKLHNALPLLVHVLGKENVPMDTESLALYRKQYIRNYLSSAIFLRELQQLLRALNDSCIAVILLKGAAFSIDLYPDLGIRPLRDTDILIHQKHIATVTEILHVSGYRRYSPAARTIIDDFHGQIAFIKEDDPTIIIEPHWTLSPEYAYSRNIKIGDFWLRSKKVRLSEVETCVFCPEDTLIHLCLHLFLHQRGGWLQNACDIVALIRHYDGSIDWDSFLKRIYEYRLCLPAQYSLNQTVQLLDAPIPDFVLRSLSEYKASKSERSLDSLRTTYSGPLGRENLATLVTISGIISKYIYLCSLLFPSVEWLKSYYQASTTSSLMLYLYHIRMIVIGGSKLLFSLVSSSLRSLFES